MAAKVVIDQEECIGCEACVEVCPEVFDFDSNEDKAYVLEDADQGAACVDEAIESCPVECITKE
jgi:ferredoxin